MCSVLTGNRNSLQFIQDESLHGSRLHTMPTLAQVNEKIKGMTKRYSEDAQRQAKGMIGTGKTPKEVMLKVQGETA